ncbi:phosducin-like protein 3 [Lineus longissimus]|uniref:phosducin-like protein 3 n=1 Tax=Lineus longissimus TaxID=88925 RepID=UPI002B4D1E8B
MQDPNEDTEWNDILRAKGIIPPKELDITEDEIQGMIDSAIKQKTEGKQMDDMDLDELDEIEDDIDEDELRIMEEIKRKRIAEIKAAQRKAVFGSVLEITKADYVKEVNNAGKDIWVILHIYKNSIPLCKLMNQHLSNLARKFPETKFIISEAHLCIENYPDKHVPTIFIYNNGDLKKQMVGAVNFGGMNLKQDDLEWILSKTDAIATTLTEPPRKEVVDVMDSAIRNSAVNNTNSDDDDDW